MAGNFLARFRHGTVYYFRRRVPREILPAIGKPFVAAGAKRIETLSFAGYYTMLALKNSDGKIVIVAQNDMRQDMPIRIAIRVRVYTAMLQADSFNTFVI